MTEVHNHQYGNEATVLADSTRRNVVGFQKGTGCIIETGVAAVSESHPRISLKLNISHTVRGT